MNKVDLVIKNSRCTHINIKYNTNKNKQIKSLRLLNLKVELNFNR